MRRLPDFFTFSLFLSECLDLYTHTSKMTTKLFNLSFVRITLID